jgi:AAA15 family ATPase/GTPase
MLIEFSVANFRSIRSRQTLSLAASRSGELRGSHLISPSSPATPELVASAVIYGANAAGKSNLIAALDFAQKFVVNSAKQGQKGDAIDVVPFLMDSVSTGTPSEFELIFVEDGVRYQYGFTVTSKRVESEWLLAFPNGRAQTWFEREAGERDWNFGSSFKGQRKVWQDATRDNALFLSTAVQLNAEQLAPVFDWFHRRLHIIARYARVGASFSIDQCNTQSSLRNHILDFLRVADLGISNVKVEKRKFDPSMLPDDLDEPYRRQVMKDMQDKEIADVHFVHQDTSGGDVLIDFGDESGGTQQLFALAGPLLDVLSKGFVLFVDELDTSLHPLLMRHLINLFHNPEINAKGAQLVFSTHDTSVLDAEVFRRDQIWFVEKDRDMATHLYPLTDFHPRKGENFERGYLKGRYGALPFVGELRV